MEFTKSEKEALRYLLKKEIECIKNDEIKARKDIPTLAAEEKYQELLEKLLKRLA